MESLPNSPLGKKDQEWIQPKNTSLLSDVLGPFPDEPLLALIDKVLYCIFNFYGVHVGPPEKENDERLPNDAPTLGLQDCSDESELLTIKKSSSIEKISDDKPPSRASSIYSSCTNLTTHISKEYIMPWVNSVKERYSRENKQKKSDLNMCGLNSNGKNYSWVTAKVKRNGVKSFEIWTSSHEARQSVIFILSPSGHAITFERLQSGVD